MGRGGEVEDKTRGREHAEKTWRRRWRRRSKEEGGGSHVEKKYWRGMHLEKEYWRGHLEKEGGGGLCEEEEELGQGLATQWGRSTAGRHYNHLHGEQPPHNDPQQVVMRRKSTCLGRREGRKFSLIGLSCVAGGALLSHIWSVVLILLKFITFLHEIKVSVVFVVSIITIILTFVSSLGTDQEETGERLMRSSQSYHTLPHPQVSCQTLPPQRVLYPLTLSRSIADRLSDPVWRSVR